MNRNDARRTPEPARPAAEQPKRRFRVERLEERIAPKRKKGGGAVTTTGGFDSIY